jgi:hypothetical protein
MSPEVRLKGVTRALKENERPLIPPVISLVTKGEDQLGALAFKGRIRLGHVLAVGESVLSELIPVDSEYL